MIVLVSAAAVLAVMAAAYGCGRALGRHNVVDTAWGIAFAAVAVVAAGLGTAPIRWLLLVLVGVWGLRLAVHLGLRARGHGEDPRYAALLDKAVAKRAARTNAARGEAAGTAVGGHPEFIVLTRIYLGQAVLVWFISLPVQLAATNSAAFAPAVVVGTLLWLIGFGFEAVGDQQLRRFKSDPAHRGRIMDRGLWRLTRHPNYFGDACLWWGLYLIAASGWPGWLTLLSPVVMTLLLTRVSGRDLLERQLASRPGYADYVARTSGFLPVPRRKISHRFTR